jgi:hypothetical protein
MATLGLSIFEGVLTQIMYPAWDPYNYIALPFIREILISVGLTMMAAGHYFRISAEMTAGQNFNH